MTLRVSPAEIVERSTSDLLAIHSSWQRIRLGDVAEVLNGFAFKSAFFTQSEGLPLLRIRDVGASGTVACYAGDYDDAYLVEPGELVVGMDGDFRVARWRGPNALLNQRVCKITVTAPELYDKDFLYYVLPGYLEAVHAFTSSVTVKHLSSRTILDLPVPLPPLAEQRRIVTAIEEQFSRLDAAERLLGDVSLRIEALRRALTREAFSGQWSARALVDLTPEDRPICYGILMPKDHIEDGVPYVRVKDFPRETIEVSALRRTSREIDEQYRRSRLRSGDVLVSIRGTYGRVAVVPPEIADANITQDTARITPNEDVDGRYLAAFLRSDPAQQHFRRVARGVAVKGVNIGDLRQLPVPLPPPDEQRRIVVELEHQLSLGESLRGAADAAAKRCRALRRAILDRAFRGELVPQDPDDEPPLFNTTLGRRAQQPPPDGPTRGGKVPSPLAGEGQDGGRAGAGYPGGGKTSTSRPSTGEGGSGGTVRQGGKHVPEHVSHSPAV